MLVIYFFICFYLNTCLTSSIPLHLKWGAAIYQKDLDRCKTQWNETSRTSKPNVEINRLLVFDQNTTLELRNIMEIVAVKSVWLVWRLKARYSLQLHVFLFLTLCFDNIFIDVITHYSIKVLSSILTCTWTLWQYM